MFKKSVKEARKRFVAGKLDGVVSLIDVLQADALQLERGKGFSLDRLNIELPVGVTSTKPVLEELEYISKCFSVLSEGALSVFDRQCRAAATSLQAEGSQRVAAE